MRLIQIQPILQNILNMLSATLDIEGSIIDNEYNLLAYTDNYLKHKGSEVHSPFIKKVMEVGEIIVSQPGHMPICKGCRFQEKCPAKIEILHAILYEGRPVGTISISSFNHADDCLIDKDIKAYAKAVLDTAILIESILHKQAQIQQMPLYEEMLRTAMDCSPDSILCVNQQGVVLNFNRNAAHLFDNHALQDMRFTAILPENRLTKLLNPDFTGRIQTQIRNRRYYVSSHPILWDHVFYGAVIRLSPDPDLEKRADYPVHYIEFDLDRILGSSPAILNLKDQIRRIAPQDSSVLIIGETGTGKELAARAVHNASPRRDKLFVPINCAAIPAEILESELFGYEKGAFTGAVKERVGKFELADGGTIFLDELTEMPQALQAKLLRVLQENTIERLGGNRSIRLDLRVIAATNREPRAAINEGKLREDLYYRINVVTIELPPLRQRVKDIAALVDHFIGKHNHAHVPTQLTAGAIAALENYAWPGNVRELENMVERALILSGGGLLDENHFMLEAPLPAKPPARASGAGARASLPLTHAIEELEAKLIDEALAQAQGNKARAAALLDISERSLWYKLKKYRPDQALN